MGRHDRILRGLAGALLMAVVLGSGLFAAAPGWAWAAVVVGAILVLTAATGMCPIYRLIGISTREKGR